MGTITTGEITRLELKVPLEKSHPPSGSQTGHATPSQAAAISCVTLIHLIVEENNGKEQNVACLPVEIRPQRINNISGSRKTPKSLDR